MQFRQIFLWTLIILPALAGTALMVWPHSQSWIGKPQITSQHRTIPDKLSDIVDDRLIKRFDLTSVPAEKAPPKKPQKIDPADALKRWQLVGVVQSETVKTALFVQNNQILSLQVSDPLEGFTLISITPRKVMFQKHEILVSLSMPKITGQRFSLNVEQ